MKALGVFHPLRIVITDHMNATTVHKFFNSLVWGFNEVSLIAQSLTRYSTQLIDKTTEQLMLAHFDIGLTVCAGEAPA